MTWTEESKRQFDDAMEQEELYAAREYSAAAAKDYHAAEFFHKMRWRCMDAAVAALVEVKA